MDYSIDKVTDMIVLITNNRGNLYIYKILRMIKWREKVTINVILTIVALFMCVVIWSLQDIRQHQSDTDRKLSQLIEYLSWTVIDTQFIPDTK